MSNAIVATLLFASQTGFSWIRALLFFFYNNFCACHKGYMNSFLKLIEHARCVPT